MLNRRDLLTGAGPLAAAGWLGLSALVAEAQDKEVPDAAPYALPPLPYPYEALEPTIDKETMKLHHDIHHAGYVKGLNAALEKLERESHRIAAVMYEKAGAAAGAPPPPPRSGAGAAPGEQGGVIEAEVEEGGILAGQELPGSTGGTLVQAGVSAGWDVRDNIVYPRSGDFAELGFNVSDEAIGSDFIFTSWNVDLRRYVSLSRSQVIVIRGLATFMLGTPPFQALAMLGGDRVLRGYYAGRFRDRQRSL